MFAIFDVLITPTTSGSPSGMPPKLKVLRRTYLQLMYVSTCSTSMLSSLSSASHSAHCRDSLATNQTSVFFLLSRYIYESTTVHQPVLVHSLTHTHIERTSEHIFCGGKNKITGYFSENKMKKQLWHFHPTQNGAYIMPLHTVFHC